ncbi:HD domain-containing protein [Heliobacillus mobilis]|uniref:HD domain-containing protein n=2 Tax=Heliobacterium TaxID=2697 RepID=A0A6I3SLD1_HELMO|nr:MULTISPECIES: HD domain-containing protein [Heliobacterium]MBC9785658.1 HD domain-containing protein [Heliobacterium chlorum]MTV49713.1 HD domain-containing protein [Heliobacterium mobile]
MSITVTFEDIKANPEVRAYIEKGNEHLGVLGYTEHGLRHAALVSQQAGRILSHIQADPRKVELACIAGFMHDIGNAVSRDSHAQIGALLARSILREMGMDFGEIAEVIAAIGNHDESVGQVINIPAAALILADKCDVHFKRVRNKEHASFDIHDRVNYAVRESSVNLEGRNITLELKTDLQISPLIDYFEIFLPRMVMCRRAASFLDCQFHLIINGARFL